MSLSVRFSICLGMLAAVCGVGSVAGAAQISGEYLEARTCDVYTGPCFANAETELAGKEAVMAWKVEEGQWGGVDLDGLGVAVVVTAERTIGFSPYFKMKPGKITSIILVDERADSSQRDALVAFAKHSAKDLTGDVKKVVATSIELKNDHLTGKGMFKAGDIAKIETRGLNKGDCVCSNEQIFYDPLTKVSDISPAYSSTLSFTGQGFDRTWTTHGQRSAFLATFRR